VKILIITGIIALFSVSNSLASETDVKVNIDGNYYYCSLNMDSYLNPENVLTLDRNRLNMKTETIMKYISNPIILNLGIRYFYNPPFAFDEDRAFLDRRNIIFFDEAKITWNVMDNAVITFGRQKFFWGPGFIKNPINVLNPPTDFRNPFFRLEEKSGVTSITGSVYSERTTITLALIPNMFKERYSQEYTIGKENIEDSITALKVDTVVLNTDLSFLLYMQEGEIPKFGLAFSRIINDVGIHGEALLQKGSHRKYINLDLPQVIEERYRDSDRLFGDYIIGLRYRSDSGHDLLVEYYRNDSGYNNKERDEFINLIKNQRFLGIGNMLFWEDTLRKNYLFFRVGLSEILPKLSLELLSVFNIDDRSFLAGSGLQYRVSEKVEAYMNIRTLHGNKESEFGMIPSKYTISSGIKVSLI
jgi:hypothetical protein